MTAATPEEASMCPLFGLLPRSRLAVELRSHFHFIGSCLVKRTVHEQTDRRV